MGAGEEMMMVLNEKQQRGEDQMNEYFITARSFAAPFMSDESEKYVEAETPQAALEQFAADYSHPCGLYAAECWRDHKHYSKKGSEPLARYLSNHEQAKQKVTAGLEGYSYLGNGPGNFEVNGATVTVEKPTEGCVV